MSLTPTIARAASTWANLQPWNSLREAALASQVQRLAPPPLELKPENWWRPVSTKPIRLPDRFKQLVIHFSQVHAEFTVADFRAANPSLNDGCLYSILNKATRLGILVKRHPVAHTGCPQKYRLAKAPGGELRTDPVNLTLDPKPQTPYMNMNKENRAELRTLKSAQRKVNRDFDREAREIARARRNWVKLYDKSIKRLDRDEKRQAKRRASATGKIEKRILILEGRLS